MTSLVMVLPLDLEFRTKGQLAVDTCADCYADGLEFDFACGDEVYGSCTRLREHPLGTPPAGSPGDAVTRPDPAGSTSAHGWSREYALVS